MRISIESQIPKILIKSQIQSGQIVKIAESIVWPAWIGCFLIRSNISNFDGFIVLTTPSQNSSYFPGMFIQFDDKNINFEILPIGTILKVEI